MALPVDDLSGFLDDLRRNQTPASISRLQNLDMMSYYAGERQEAEKMLDRTARLGLDSKMFDCARSRCHPQHGSHGQVTRL